MRVAVPWVPPVMRTGLVEPKLKVGRYCATAGLDVRTTASVTLPVKPPLGITVIVDVPLPPGLGMVMLPPPLVRVIPVTVTFTVAVAVVVSKVPVTVTA